MKSIRSILMTTRHFGGLQLYTTFAALLFLAASIFSTPLVSSETLHATYANTAQATVASEPSPAPKPATKTSKTATSKKATKSTAATGRQVASTTTSTTASSSRSTVSQVTPTPAYDTVSIPSIGFSSRFVTVGVTESNAIDVHPTLVGWWNGSAKPGSSGAVFLDGHNPGVFSKLPTIAVGASIQLKMASGSSYTYTVVHREIVPLGDVDMNEALSVYGNATEGLNLMTCIGPYNPAIGTTDKRLIVYAVRS